VSRGGAAAAAGLAVVVLACAANVAVLNKQEPVQAATAAKATLAPVTTE
jgi:hypothetical protein